MPTVNLDFQAELEAQNTAEPVKTLKVPITEDEKLNDVQTISKEALFGKDALIGKLPELTQEFVILKSKQDKLVELGNVAQEVYETKKVSRGQVIAIESLARELIPASENEMASGDRKVVVSDHEVNMYTEEPSATEAANTITNCQANVDRIVSDIRNSAIALGKQLIITANNDTDNRDERVIKGVALFNLSIAKFLAETDSRSLEDTSIRFKRDLAWGNLMCIAVRKQGPDDGDRLEQQIQSFDGTSAETFVKTLFDLINYGPISFVVLNNFVNGEYCIVRDSDQARDNNKDLPWMFTIGSLLEAFGSSRFSHFYAKLSQETFTQVKATESVLALLEGETSIVKIIELSDNLQKQQQCLMNINSNMAVLAAVQKCIIDFLSTF